MLVAVNVTMLGWVCCQAGEVAVRRHIAAAAGVNGLDLVGMRMQRTVGSEDAIGAEGVVILDAGDLTKVAASYPASVFDESLI